MTAEQNYRLLQELDANRRFMLLAYRDNPALLEKAEVSIQMRFLPTGAVVQTPECTAASESPVLK